MRYAATFLLVAAFVFASDAASRRLDDGHAARARRRRATNAPIAGATVTAVSPSQTATTTTDGSGAFSFLALNPDTYTLRVEKPAIRRRRSRGRASLPIKPSTFVIALSPALKTIGRVAARRRQAAWCTGHDQRRVLGQRVGPEGGAVGRRIRARSIKPTARSRACRACRFLRASKAGIRASTSAAATTTRSPTSSTACRSCGNRTSRRSSRSRRSVSRKSRSIPAARRRRRTRRGSPATSIKSSRAARARATRTVDGAIGAPQFYHFSRPRPAARRPTGSSPTTSVWRAANQTYRYVDQFNGVSDPQYFYPLTRSKRTTPCTSSPTAAARCNRGPGSCVGDPELRHALFAGCVVLSSRRFRSRKRHELSLRHPASQRRRARRRAAALRHREHRNAVLLLVQRHERRTASVRAAFPISTRRTTAARSCEGAEPVDNSIPGAFPYSPTDRVYNNSTVNGTTTTPSLVGLDQRDGNNVGFSVEKVQYQRNFDNHSYLRVLGYSEFSDWLINGPNGAQLDFAADPAEYDVLAWIYGAVAIYSNQLGSKNLLTASLRTTRRRCDVRRRVRQRRAELARRDRSGHGALELRREQRQLLQLRQRARSGAASPPAAKAGSSTNAARDVRHPQNFPYICLTPKYRAGRIRRRPKAGAHWIMTGERRRRAVRRRAARSSDRSR